MYKRQLLLLPKKRAEPVKHLGQFWVGTTSIGGSVFGRRQQLAIESFKMETGRYPDSLDVLMPKYLTNIPDLKFANEQPRVTYRVTDGKSYLAISSAWGVFAHFEYDFASKVWNFYD